MMSVMANPKRNLEREEVICRLYQEGRTLQEVGDVFQLTRERVRQLVRRAGVMPSDGGQAKRTQRRRRERIAHRQIERDAKTQANYGCYHDQAVALNGGQNISSSGSPAQFYFMQRKNAMKRGIEWSITFPEWLSVWHESGHLPSRGRRANAYVMGRCRDTGPYEIGNVYITTSRANVSDYQAELKRRGVVCADGYKRLPERAALMSQE
jgi:hypothetical protein